jgi:ectoine hydroxylase-related dioxygenase (phytanoyl-CoA dioxygenase family)
MLTAEQQGYFETFGFLVMRQYFSPEEMAAIQRDFDEVLAEDRQGRPFAGEKRQAVLGFAEMRPRLMQLLEEDRIYEPIEQLLGPGFVWIGSDGNLYVGDTGWHPDSASHCFDYPRIKVAFYLDPMTKETGCLRVLPGSHRRPLFDDAAGFRHLGPELPGFALETEPGDVVFFSQNLWHSSWGGKTGRRMFTLNYGAKPSGEKDLQFLRDCYQGNLRHTHEMGGTPRDWMYGERLLGSDRPRLRSMTALLVTLGFR